MKKTLIEAGLLIFNCENLVKIFAIESMPGRQDLYMELCDKSLKDYYITDTQSIELGDLQHVVRGVLTGLVHLHDLKIIHRDIHPGNILLKKTSESERLRDMVVKLGDFNIMKWSPEEERTPTQTSFSAVQFRAPELLLKRQEGVTVTRYMNGADIWSLGAVIFYLRTKKNFVSKDEIEKENLDDILIKKLRAVCHESLQKFLEKCLKKNYRERMTARDLLHHEFLS